MLEEGATPEEIRQVRAADRAAQGITQHYEAQGEQALASAEILADGRLTIVRLPHTHTAVVTDRLEPVLGGPGYVNLLVVSPGQLNFFGKGEFVQGLQEKFGGWWGGALPKRGFWGHGEPVPDVVSVLVERIRGQEGKSRDREP
jgi:hypothetical protein